MKEIKCTSCGSTDIMVRKVELNAELSKKDIKRLKKYLNDDIDDIIIECHGDCEDEVSVIFKHESKELKDVYDILNTLVGNNISNDIITVLSTNDVEGIKKYIEKFITEGISLDSSLSDIDSEEYDKEEGCFCWPILIYAIDENAHKVAIELIKAGANPNITIPWTGLTPLMKLCAQRGKSDEKLELTKVLLDFGADLSITDDDGRDVFRWLKNWGGRSKKMAKLIDNY